MEARPIGAGEGISAKHFDHTKNYPHRVCGIVAMVGVVNAAVPLLGRAVYHGVY